jgi:hypothetical protein
MLWAQKFKGSDLWSARCGAYLSDYSGEIVINDNICMEGSD